MAGEAKKAEEAKAEGTSRFKMGDFPGAVEAYSRAIGSWSHSSEDLRILYGNRSMAQLKIGGSS